MNIPELTVLAPVCGADGGALERRISAHPIRLTMAMTTKFVCRIKLIVKIRSVSAENYREFCWQCYKMRSLIMYQISLNSVRCRAMAEVVSRRPFTAGARIKHQAFPCGVCVGQVLVFFFEYFNFSLLGLFPQCSKLIRSSTTAFT